VVTSAGLIESKSALQNRWWIVAASLIGNVVGLGPAVIFTTNVFTEPVTTEFHWSRGMFSASLLASALVSAIMTPLFGNLIDRFGIRRVTLPAAALYALALCSFSLLRADAFWAVFLMVACACGFGASLGPLVFSESITAWFDKERGLALGIATCGVGLGTLALPALAEFFIKSFGWRMAYISVGVTTFVLGFSMIALFVCEPPGFIEHMRAARAHPALGVWK
jgi:MFS family permease